MVRWIFCALTSKFSGAARRPLECEVLPATADSVSRYLAEHATRLAYGTLKQRMAALATWHCSQGFPDPTKTPIAREVLKGIRALHPAVEKQAAPLQIAQLEQIVNWLEVERSAGQKRADAATELRCRRNKALLQICFWRGFRGEELKRLQCVAHFGFISL